MDEGAVIFSVGLMTAADWRELAKRSDRSPSTLKWGPGEIDAILSGERGEYAMCAYNTGTEGTVLYVETSTNVNRQIAEPILKEAARRLIGGGEGLAGAEDP